MHCSSYLFDFTAQRMHAVLRAHSEGIGSASTGGGALPPLFVDMVHQFAQRCARHPPLGAFLLCSVTCSANSAHNLTRSP